MSTSGRAAPPGRAAPRRCGWLRARPVSSRRSRCAPPCRPSRPHCQPRYRPAPPSGQRLKQVRVQVETPAEAQSGLPTFTQSTKDGVFTVRNLIPGAYAVNFGCVFGRDTYASQWFKGQPGQGTSDYVSAPAGAVTSGIDAVMRPGGFITGVVTSSAHKGLGGICVQAISHGGSFPTLDK